MKTLLITLTAICSAIIASEAHAASTISTTIGNTTFYSGDINASSTRIGNTTFYSGDISGSSTKIGNHTFYSGNISGSSYHFD